jgi:hypothetical protein
MSQNERTRGEGRTLPTVAAIALATSLVLTACSSHSGGEAPTASITPSAASSPSVSPNQMPDEARFVNAVIDTQTGENGPATRENAEVSRPHTAIYRFMNGNMAVNIQDGTEPVDYRYGVTIGGIVPHKSHLLAGPIIPRNSLKNVAAELAPYNFVYREPKTEAITIMEPSPGIDETVDPDHVKLRTPTDNTLSTVVTSAAAVKIIDHLEKTVVNPLIDASPYAAACNAPQPGGAKSDIIPKPDSRM